jgi:hypothetical protein
MSTHPDEQYQQTQEALLGKPGAAISLHCRPLTRGDQVTNFNESLKGTLGTALPRYSPGTAGSGACPGRREIENESLLNVPGCDIPPRTTGG